jgi:hypothetical protein
MMRYSHMLSSLMIFSILLESYIFSSALQSKLSLSSKPCLISIIVSVYDNEFVQRCSQDRRSRATQRDTELLDRLGARR